ncbi:ABC-2 type transport system ATP-binding protein [Paracidovorax citrulli]|nr:ABC-2 type transport system ATP-binding protein [Paracidovorax citrulli]
METMTIRPIVLRGLGKRYGNHVAVHGLDLEVDSGRCLGLIGHNGAGKTTSLCMLAGLVVPTCGTATILGKNIAKRPKDVLARINFMSAYMDLPGGLKVRELLLLFARLYGLDRVRERVEQSMNDFGIDPSLGGRFVNTLSAGQRAKVLLAKGFVNAPQVVLLDEPTAALDPVSARSVRASIANAKRIGGTTIVLASHNMRDIGELCDEVLFIARGRVVAYGAPEVLRQQYHCADLDELYIRLSASAA